MQSAGYTSVSLMLGALNGSEKTENCSNLCWLPPGNVKVWEDGHLQQAKDRAVSFSSCQGCLHILRRGRGCLLCRQDSSLHHLHQRNLLPLRAPLSPARYWESQDSESVCCKCPLLTSAHGSWAAEWLLAKFLDTGGL